MKATIIAITAAGLLAGSSAIVMAENSTSDRTPGHLMKDKGSKGEPGASYYAPGHVKERKGSKKGYPGASGWAPGHANDSTTGQGPSRRK